MVKSSKTTSSLSHANNRSRKRSRLISKNVDPFHPDRNRNRRTTRKHSYRNNYRSNRRSNNRRKHLRRRSHQPRRLLPSLSSLPAPALLRRRPANPFRMQSRAGRYLNWKPGKLQRRPRYRGRLFPPRKRKPALFRKVDTILWRAHRRVPISYYYRRRLSRREAGKYRYRTLLATAQAQTVVEAIRANRTTVRSASQIGRNVTARNLRPGKRRVVTSFYRRKRFWRSRKATRRARARVRARKRELRTDVSKRRRNRTTRRTLRNARSRPMARCRFTLRSALTAITSAGKRSVRTLFPRYRTTAIYRGRRNLRKERKRRYARRSSRRARKRTSVRLAVMRQLLRKVRALHPAVQRFFRRRARRRAVRRVQTDAKRLSAFQQHFRKRRLARKRNRRKLQRYLRLTPAILRAARERILYLRNQSRQRRADRSSLFAIRTALRSVIAKRGTESLISRLEKHRTIATRLLLNRKHRSSSVSAVGSVAASSTQPRQLIYRSPSVRENSLFSLHKASRIASVERQSYRFRPKFRLPRQYVNRVEQKFEGLTIFTRQTLKRPQIAAGKGRLLLPAIGDLYTPTTQRVLAAKYCAAKSSAFKLPNLIRDKQPRFWLPSPRRYTERLSILKVRKQLTNHLLEQTLQSQAIDRKVLASTASGIKWLEAAKGTRNSLRDNDRRKVESWKRHPARKFFTNYVRARLRSRRTRRGPQIKRASVQKSVRPSSRALLHSFEIKERLDRALPLLSAKVSKQGLIKLERLQTRLAAVLADRSRLREQPAKGSNLPSVPLTKVNSFNLQPARHSNRVVRRKALLHLRSVNGMLAQERNLSAWSPQYSPDSRRLAYPRVFGRRIPIRRVGRETQRLRHVFNKTLATWGKPQRRYTDYAIEHLQLQYGSAASLGYARYRRVYRPKSRGNRWWAPLTQPVPFAHPYSRRSLNSKRLLRTTLFNSSVSPTVGATTALIRRRWFERRAEPTEIPRRSVRLILPRRGYYKMRPVFGGKPKRMLRKRRVWVGETKKEHKERRRNARMELPQKVRFWKVSRKATVEKVVAPRSSSELLLARTRRSIRRLERTFPRYNLWSKYRWTAFDLKSSPHSAMALYHTIMGRLQTRLPRMQSYLTQQLQLRLFARFRNWLANSSAITSPTQESAAAAFLLNELGTVVHNWNEKRNYGTLEATEQTRLLNLKQDRFWTLRQHTGDNVSIYKKSSHPMRRRWLHGAERYLKRSQVGRLPPRHRRGGDHRMVNYGRVRRRFPASGRRRHTYESALYAFIKRVGPSRIRRVNTLRFSQLRPLIDSDSKVQQVRYQLTRLRRVQRTIAQRLSRVAYLSTNWKELLTVRSTDATKVQPAPFAGVTKRRFASLPLNLQFKRKRVEQRALRSARLYTLHAHRTGLLHAALVRRRLERPFVELRKHISYRRLPRETALYTRRRREESTEEYQRFGQWGTAPKPEGTSWTLKMLETKAHLRTNRAKVVALTNATGDSLLLTPQLARRTRWALRGFGLFAPKKQSHRRRKYRRRPWFEHRAERRSYRKGRRFGKRTAGSLTRLRKRAVRLQAQAAPIAHPKKVFYKRAVLARFRASSNPVTGASLIRLTSLQRSRGLNRLRRRATFRRSKFMRRQAAALRRQQQRIVVKSVAPHSYAQTHVAHLNNFNDNDRTSISPLTFLNRTRRRVKTEAERLRAVIWNIQSKEQRYRRTAQYTESLTKFIPALMSYMISRHVRSKKLTFNSVKGLISATYWNLRIYLNVDPFAKRLFLRDNNFATLRFLAKTVGKLAKEQITEHVQRTHLRWRFQPFRMQRAPSSDRFRLDWLRAFFPRKHALYQENPERYVRALVATRNIRRVPLTGYGIARARTYNATSNVEKRARHLLMMRLSRNDPRLETVLQTIHREPTSEVEQYSTPMLPESEEEVQKRAAARAEKLAQEDAAIYARSKKFVFVKGGRRPKRTAVELMEQAITLLLEKQSTAPALAVGRESFFSRNFSSLASRPLIGISRLIALQHRLSTPEGKAAAPFQRLIARARIKPRLVARGRTNFVASADFMINAGGLDPRFHRYKSARSRQYKLRLPISPSKQVTILTVQQFEQKRAALTKQEEGNKGDEQLLRLRRRFFRPELPRSPRQPAVTALLHSLRTTVASRHVTDSLQSRSALFYSSRKGIYGARSILCTRSAAHRSPRYSARHAPVVTYRAATFKGAVLSKSKIGQRANRIAQRKGVSTGSTAANFLKQKLQLGKAELLRASSLQQIGKQSRFTRRCLTRQRIGYQTPFDSFRPALWHMTTHRWTKRYRVIKEWLKNTKLWLKEPWVHRVVVANRTRPTKLEMLHSKVALTRQALDKNKEAYKAAVLAAKQKGKRLTERARNFFRATAKRLYEHGTALNRKIRITPKDRPTYWLANEQCRRWVGEKEDWLKKTKAEKHVILAEMKQKSIESVRAGKGRTPQKAAPLKVPANHFIPTVIWKDIQRRARRLPWRESDEEFFRPGFRNAFNFYPTERNRAPWLEAMLLTRSLYSTKLTEFRRRQFPREQKKHKWLQRVRKSFFPGRTNNYIKGRRWPRLRIYNQRLHYSLFSMPDRNFARRHFRKLTRRSRVVGFARLQEGTSNRLDNVLIHLNMAPTIFVARIVATRGLLRVNGKVAYGADFRLQPGDYIEPVWDKVIAYRQFFKNFTTVEGENRTYRWSPTGVSANFEYHHKLGTYTYKGPAREGELRVSSRLQPHLFRWFCLDSGAKKSVT